MSILFFTYHDLIVHEIKTFSHILQITGFGFDIAKPAWEKVIKEDSMVTFSRYFYRKIPFPVNDAITKLFRFTFTPAAPVTLKAFGSINSK